MKKEEIIFTTGKYDPNKIPHRICLIACFVMTLACIIKTVQRPHILIPLIIIMVLIVICFVLSLITSYRRRSYIVLTDNEVRGVSYPARDCTSGFYSFSLYYMEIFHVDLEKNFIILYTHFGRYKIFTETEGPLIKFFLDQCDTERGKEIFEKTKSVFQEALEKERENRKNKKRKPWR